MKTVNKSKQSKKMGKGKIMVYIMLLFLILTLLYAKNRYSFGIVSGPSMLPTFHDKEVFYIRKTHKVKNGDIIVIKSKNNNDRNIIKRVIASNGDKLVIKDSKVYVNNKEVSEPYIKEKEFEGTIDITIPKNAVFVMGDNRNMSKDSREVGTIQTKHIVGIVKK